MNPRIPDCCQAGLNTFSNFIGGYSVKGHKKIILVLTFTHIFIFSGPTLMDLLAAAEQTKGKMVLSQETGRDPFLLPSGIRLISKMDTTLGTKETLIKMGSKQNEILPSPLKVKAILISDRIRLALIDRHIVKVGDPIQDEKVLEIKPDRVILGKGDQKRTLLLSQSPVLLTVEEEKGEKR